MVRCIMIMLIYDIVFEFTFSQFHGAISWIDNRKKKT